MQYGNEYRNDVGNFKGIGILCAGCGDKEITEIVTNGTPMTQILRMTADHPYKICEPNEVISSKIKSVSSALSACQKIVNQNNGAYPIAENLKS